MHATNFEFKPFFLQNTIHSVVNDYGALSLLRLKMQRAEMFEIDVFQVDFYLFRQTGKAIATANSGFTCVEEAEKVLDGDIVKVGEINGEIVAGARGVFALGPAVLVRGPDEIPDKLAAAPQDDLKRGRARFHILENKNKKNTLLREHDSQSYLEQILMGETFAKEGSRAKAWNTSDCKPWLNKHS